MIVFLAVPALQRNSRNTGRKEDAGRIAAAILNFQININGGRTAGWSSSPSPANNWFNGNGGGPGDDCETIAKDIGNTSNWGYIYSGAVVTCWGNDFSDTLSSNGYKVGSFLFMEGAINGTDAAQTISTPLSNDGLVYMPGGVCNGAVYGSSSGRRTITLQQGNLNQSALIYTIETGNGLGWGCDQVS